MSTRQGNKITVSGEDFAAAEIICDRALSKLKIPRLIIHVDQERMIVTITLPD